MTRAGKVEEKRKGGRKRKWTEGKRREVLKLVGGTNKENLQRANSYQTMLNEFNTGNISNSENI